MVMFVEGVRVEVAVAVAEGGEIEVMVMIWCTRGCVRVVLMLHISVQAQRN